MISKEIQQEYLEGKRTKIFHTIHGEGTVTMARVDKLANNRIKAVIEFPVMDLLEEKTKPEFLFLDDENLSEVCQ